MIHATDALSFTAHVGRKCWVDMPHMAGAFPGEEGGWVSEQPLTRMMDAR